MAINYKKTSLNSNSADDYQEVYISLGTNLGDKKSNLSSAKTKLEAAGQQILNESAIYQTAPWGKTDQPDFFNQVIKIQSFLEARELMDLLLEIEFTMGRKREEKFGPRIIDLDLLIFGDKVVDESQLQIPHLAMASRRFILKPLAEIAASLVHPVSGKTIRQMLKECRDDLAVHKIEGDFK